MIHIVETQRKFSLDPHRTDLTMQEQVSLIRKAPRRKDRIVGIGEYIITPPFTIFAVWILEAFSPTRGEIRKELPLVIKGASYSMIASHNENLDKPSEIIPISLGSVEPCAEPNKAGIIRTRRFVICDGPEKNQTSDASLEKEVVQVEN